MRLSRAGTTQTGDCQRRTKSVLARSGLILIESRQRRQIAVVYRSLLSRSLPICRDGILNALRIAFMTCNYLGDGRSDVYNLQVQMRAAVRRIVFDIHWMRGRRESYLI